MGKGKPTLLLGMKYARLRILEELCAEDQKVKWRYLAWNRGNMSEHSFVLADSARIAST